MDFSSKIISLDHQDPEQVAAAARLHQCLLAEGPVPQLGYQFMTRFYYSKLIKAELINCNLYRHQGKYIAFLVYTKYPFTFMATGLRRYFLYLLFLLVKILFAEPARLKTVFKVMQLNHKRQMRKDEGKTGEILSFGVLEPYANLRDQLSGLRISHLLFEQALAYFKKAGFTRVLGAIKKDNKLSLLFYHSYGGVITDYNWHRYSYLITIKLNG